MLLVLFQCKHTAYLVSVVPCNLLQATFGVSRPSAGLLASWQVSADPFWTALGLLPHSMELGSAAEGEREYGGEAAVVCVSCLFCSPTSSIN